MTEIDKLVENYFAPRPKTLTKQMLYEMFDEAVRGQEEQSDADPFSLEPALSGKEVASILLGKIAQVSSLPKDAIYKDGKTTIVLDNFGQLQDRDKVLSALMKAGIVSEMKPYRAGLSREGLTNYYSLTKSGKKKFIKLVLKQGAGTIASRGSRFERAAAAQINAFLADRSLEDDFISDVVIDAIAIGEGGSSKESDVVIRDSVSKEILFSIETKTSKSSRTDLGQFRIKYENGIWEKAPSREVSLKDDKETQQKKKLSKIMQEVFEQIEVPLNEKIRPVGSASFPMGSSLTREEAEEFWHALGLPRGDKSLSGDVGRFKIDKNLIQQYYSEKGDTYVIIGNDIYSLKKGSLLKQFSEAIDTAYALLRIKYHGPKYSYTVALRADFAKDSDTGFKKSLEIIFPSLPNPEEV